MAAIHFTKDNFDSEVLQSEVPVLVDFWATWCGPCRMVGPIVEQISDEYAGKAKVGKIDVDQQPELAQRYGVMTIPTLAVFKGGEIVNKQVGAVPKPRLAEMIDGAL